MYAAAAGILSLPIVLLGRHRVNWRTWELLALVTPFCLWFFLPHIFPASSTDKGWGNLSEPFFFAPAVPLIAVIRVAAGKALPLLTSGYSRRSCSPSHALR